MWPPSGPEMPKSNHRKNLTPTLITGLKPAADGERYQVMDAQVPGFGVRVTDKGNKTFIFRTRYPGSSSPARREIGNCVDMNLTDAREKARKWRSLVKQGIDPAVQEERERRERIKELRTTFGAVAEDFIAVKLPEDMNARKLGKHSQRSHIHRKRDDLPDQDEALWPPGLGDQPEDPWKDTRYLHLIDPKTAADFTFVTDSYGGRRTASELKRQIGNMRAAKDLRQEL
jgi:hypothetical protein